MRPLQIELVAQQGFRLAGDAGDETVVVEGHVEMAQRVRPQLAEDVGVHAADAESHDQQGGGPPHDLVMDAQCARIVGARRQKLFQIQQRMEPFPVAVKDERFPLIDFQRVLAHGMFLLRKWPRMHTNFTNQIRNSWPAGLLRPQTPRFSAVGSCTD